MVNSDKIMIMICARISFFYYARILDSRPPTNKWEALSVGVYKSQGIKPIALSNR